MHCIHCRDKNFLIECKCGCGGILFLRDKWKWNRGEKRYIKNHDKRISDRPLTDTERQKRYTLAHPDRVRRNRMVYNDKRYQNPVYRAQTIARSHRTYHTKTKEILDKHKLGIRFFEKWIHIGWNPRMGVCSSCGRRVGKEIRLTNMHHAKGYFHIFPWYGVEELCVGCHSKTDGAIFQRWGLST